MTLSFATTVEAIIRLEGHGARNWEQQSAMPGPGFELGFRMCAAGSAEVAIAVLATKD